MTRVHFTALARALRMQRPSPEGTMQRFNHEYLLWQAIVIEIADVCHAFNAQFDRDRFYFAAGMVTL